MGRNSSFWHLDNDGLRVSQRFSGMGGGRMPRNIILPTRGRRGLRRAGSFRTFGDTCGDGSSLATERRGPRLPKPDADVAAGSLHAGGGRSRRLLPDYGSRTSGCSQSPGGLVLRGRPSLPLLGPPRQPLYVNRLEPREPCRLKRKRPDHRKPRGPTHDATRTGLRECKAGGGLSRHGAVLRSPASLPSPAPAESSLRSLFYVF